MKCDLKLLKDLISKEKKAILYIRQHRPTGMSNYFEDKPLDVLFSELKDDVSVFMVGVDKSAACREISDFYDAHGNTPVLIALKDGREIDRLTPKGYLNDDIKKIRDILKKLE